MSEFKFVVLEPTARETQEIFPYQTEDEDVNGFKCFKTFADAKHFYLECLEDKVGIALTLRAKDVK